MVWDTVPGDIATWDELHSLAVAPLGWMADSLASVAGFYHDRITIMTCFLIFPTEGWFTCRLLPAWLVGPKVENLRFRRLYFVYGGAREVGIAGNVNKLALALYNFKGIQLLSTISLWPMWLGWK
jgi:hypothetical protein